MESLILSPGSHLAMQAALGALVVIGFLVLQFSFRPYLDDRLVGYAGEGSGAVDEVDIVACKCLVARHLPLARACKGVCGMV